MENSSKSDRGSNSDSDDGDGSDNRANDSRGSSEAPDPIEIPVQALDDVILKRIIEEFVLREGTDYGAREVSLETKTAQVLHQLEKGDVKIFFDPASESVNIVQVRKGL